MNRANVGGPSARGWVPIETQNAEAGLKVQDGGVFWEINARFGVRLPRKFQFEPKQKLPAKDKFRAGIRTSDEISEEMARRVASGESVVFLLSERFSAHAMGVLRDDSPRYPNWEFLQAISTRSEVARQKANLLRGAPVHRRGSYDDRNNSTSVRPVSGSFEAGKRQ